jgi:hypothetical protein
MTEKYFPDMRFETYPVGTHFEVDELPAHLTG